MELKIDGRDRMTHSQAPSPRGHLLLGNLMALRRDLLATFSRWQHEHGDIVRFRVGWQIGHLLCHPEMAHQVLIQRQSAFGKVSLNGQVSALQLVLGNGLLISDGEFWRRQRRMMQPSFHRSQIAAMADKITGAGERLLARLPTSGPDEPIDIAHEMMDVTLDVISQSIFSTNVMLQFEHLESSLTMLRDFVFKDSLNPLRLPFSWPPRRYKRALKMIDDAIYALIEERRASGKRYDDLLDMLLQVRDKQTGQGMSDQEVRDEISTIFAAGHDTIAQALTWSWYLLALHPSTQERMRAELSQVLGGRTPTLADLPQLSYTKQVLEESMRLYPPTPFLFRFMKQDSTMNGFHLAAGSHLILSIYHIHHHPDFWPEPEVFDPDRFAPANQQQRHRSAYMPFGGGRRLCIGKHFALMEGQLLLAMIAQKYELRLVPGHAVEMEMTTTLQPRDGLKMTWHRVA
jgi:cytochrome P450